MTSSTQAGAADSNQERNGWIGLPSLMRTAFSGGDLKPLAEQLLAHASAHPDDAQALMDLSTILLLSWHRDLALTMQKDALQTRQLYPLCAPAAPRLRLLVLKSAGDLMANTPVDFLVEASDVAADVLYVGDGIPAVSALPEHDVLFVAVGESDDNAPLLAALDDVARDWPRPVVNAPARIAHLARDAACALLQGIPGLVMPTAVRVDRQALERIGRGEGNLSALTDGLDFPIIARPVGSHAGQALRRLLSADAIPDYLHAVPTESFYVARFVDYRSADGLFRKYRIMLIGGKPFLCHMAISSHWMIHYLNAGMTDSAEKRAEEARAMESFDQDFAARHAAALQALADRIGLDYFGIDCGETPDGDLLVFEADSDMIVHAMDPVDLFPYKAPHMQRLFAAFRDMLAAAAAR